MAQVGSVRLLVKKTLRIMQIQFSLSAIQPSRDEGGHASRPRYIFEATRCPPKQHQRNVHTHRQVCLCTQMGWPVQRGLGAFKTEPGQKLARMYANINITNCVDIRSWLNFD